MLALFLSFVGNAAQDGPPAGGISPLSWVFIVALAGVIGVSVPALWYRGNKIQDRMYEDLKECNQNKANLEEEVLGLLKVLSLQMEEAKGGKKR